MDRSLSDLSLRLDFWEAVRDLQNGFQKCSAFKQTPIFTEVACKYFRRALESGSDLKLLNEQLTSLADTPSTDAYKLSVEIRDIMLNCFANDIEFWPEMLPELIKERETNKDNANDAAIALF